MACTDTATQQTQDNVVTVLPDTGFYKRLEGTWDGKKVVVNLSFDGNSYRGSNLFIPVKNIWQLLQPYTEENHPTTLTFEIGTSGNDIFILHTLDWKAWYISGKDSVALQLQESYPVGTIQFAYYSLKDSQQQCFHDTTCINATAEHSFPLPVSPNQSIQDWLHSVLTLDTLSNQPDVFTGVQTLHQQFFEGWRSVLPDAADSSDIPASFYNFSSYDQVSILYNDCGILALEAFQYTYEGGAHGNYFSTQYCYDLREMKKLKLHDILQLDSIALQHAVEKNFRKQYHLGKKPLNEILFENNLPYSENWFATSTGIQFLYNPYEVAPYAVGQIRVFVPFEDILSILQPAWRERLEQQNCEQTH